MIEQERGKNAADGSGKQGCTGKERRSGADGIPGRENPACVLAYPASDTPRGKMGRGRIYEIETDADEIGCMGEENFYDMLGELGVGSVSDMGRDCAADMIDVLKKFGAETGEENGCMYFILKNSVKRNYFLKRFNEAKKRMEKMTLDEFSLDDPYTLRLLIHNDYGDGVYFKNGFHTMDNFLRLYAKTGVRYYVGNVVAMH